VLGYDYPGYGYSVGPISEADTYDALESCYHHVIRKHQIPASQIVLYGRSMGSAPTVHLAAQCAVKPDSLDGVILESALLSIVRTCNVFKSKTRWFDMFANVDKIGRLTHSVFITHGRTDTVVPFWHAEELFRLIQSRKEYAWVDHLGHNDMPDVWQYRDAPKEKGESDEEYDKKVAETKQLNILNKEHRLRLRRFLESLPSRQGAVVVHASNKTPRAKNLDSKSSSSQSPTLRGGKQSRKMDEQSVAPSETSEEDDA